jgi:protein-L-isoaspartate O-methyltransferase
VKAASGLIIFIVCCFFGHSTSFAFWENDLTYEGESVYNYLQVKEDPYSVILSTNVLFGVQSIRIKSGELTGMYYDYAMAAPYMSGIKEKAEAGENAEILILGMGTGTYATQILKYFDNVNVEGVEIDDKITDLAHKYFELPEKAKVTTYDGRAYLAAIDKKYDVIMVDAYQDITIPFQMSSTEFFNMVKEHLNPGGVMVVNMNMYSDDNESTINRYLADTISSVFDNVVTVKVQNSTNKELFATDNAEFMNRFAENSKLEGDEKLREMMDIVEANCVPYDAGNNIMTDDKAPVELLGMRQIDSIIKDEVKYYKEIYKTQGLEGLF